MENGENCRNFLVGEFLCAALGCACRQADISSRRGRGWCLFFHQCSLLFFPLFPSHPECWYLDSWGSEQLESGTARLPWAFLKQPVPGWLWPSLGTGCSSSPRTTLTPSLPGQCLSSSPPAPPLFPLGLSRLQSGMAGVPQVLARLSWTLSAFSTSG